MFTSINTFVALAPAIACAHVGFFVEVAPRLKRYGQAFTQSAEKVEWLRVLAAM